MKTKFLLIICMFLISLGFISAVSVTDVSTSPAEVSPGETVKVTLEIENIFDYDVYNLNVKLDLSGENVPFAPYESSSEKFLDELESDENEDFEFRLIVLPDTSTGIYKIPVEISYSYKEGNDTFPGNKTELISITVNSKPELKISLDDSAVLIKGRENTFSIKIINSGLSDVKFVYISINETTKLKIFSEKEQYIGDIDSDDFDSAKYNVYLEEDTPNSISLPVTLKFRDSTNKEFSETKTLTLKIYSLKEAQALGLVKKPNFLPYVITLVLLAGYVVYRILKKRKLKKDRR